MGYKCCHPERPSIWHVPGRDEPWRNVSKPSAAVKTAGANADSGLGPRNTRDHSQRQRQIRCTEILVDAFEQRRGPECHLRDTLPRGWRIMGCRCTLGSAHARSCQQQDRICPAWKARVVSANAFTSTDAVPCATARDYGIRQGSAYESDIGNDTRSYLGGLFDFARRSGDVVEEECGEFQDHQDPQDGENSLARPNPVVNRKCTMLIQTLYIQLLG